MDLIEKVKIPDFPGLEEISFFASLAYHGLLKSVTVDSLRLRNVDLSSVPVKHLASLVSCVSKTVEIRSRAKVPDLVSFMDSIKGILRYMYVGVSLGTEETQALVRVMESHLVKLRIGKILDIEALTQYSGQGKCSKIQCYDPSPKYNEKLKTWAKSKSWKTRVIDNYLELYQLILDPDELMELYSDRV